MAAAVFTQMLLNVTECFKCLSIELGLTCLGLLAGLMLALDVRGAMPGAGKHIGAVAVESNSAKEDDTPSSRMSSRSTSVGSDSPSSPRSSCTDDSVQDASYYHGSLSERVSSGDQRGAWRLVTEMQVNGASPNGTTCAILLKCQPETVETVSRVLLLADSVEEPMDDAFFVALADACIRVGRLDFLTKQVEKLQRQGLCSILSAATYCSLIKAYGNAHDMKRVWDLWNQLRNNQVALDSTVVSYMMHMLVGSGQSTEAGRLVQDLEKDESARHLLESDVYSIILKGFASAQQIEKAMRLYRDMKSKAIAPNKEAFDALLKAFAQRGAMEQVPEVMDDMKMAAPAVEPDEVTYSALVKGFCNAGSLDRALKIFKGMQTREKCSPGEVVYNDLLSGCVKESRPDEALELLGEMRKTKTPPTSHNLGLLVKLLARNSRLEEAFQMLEEIKDEFSVKIDLQVYNRLIQGCFHNGRANKALEVYDKINREGPPFPDNMTYTALVRGLIRMGILDKALELVRCAHGIGVADHTFPGLDAGCLDEVVVALGGADSERGMALLDELRDRLPARGTLNETGDIIEWSNGEVWHRARSSTN